MADLTTSITESVTINGSVRGSTNSLTVTGINNVFERVVTCDHSQATKIAIFAAEPHTTNGAIDVNNVRYIRITNLDANGALTLSVQTTNTNFIQRLTPATSYVLARAEAVVIGEEDPDAAIGATLENVTALIIMPEGTTYNPDVELFIASV